MPDGTMNLGGMHMKKNTVIIAAAGGVLVIGVLIYRHKQAQSKAVADAGANTGIDPATGYAYGSPEDAAALANQQNYVNPADYTSGIYTGQGTGAGGISGVGGLNTPGSFVNNAAWAQYAESYLINILGSDASTVGNAIGKYLTGQPLDDNMVAVVQSAIAAAGYPPVAGTNGNPPGYITAHTGSTNPPPPSGGGNPPPEQMETVPHVIGKTAGEAHNEIVSAGLIPVADPGQKATWIVTSTTPVGGHEVPKGTRVLITAKAPAHKR